MRTRRHFSLPWAFWALAVAWLLASAPPLMLPDLVAWAKDSARFSHQERLGLEVATLLSRDASPAVDPCLAAAPAEPEPDAPLIAETTPVKITLSLQPAHIPLYPPSNDGFALAMSSFSRSAPVADVPHPPPRDGGLFAL